jgi:predicted nucleic acid-binding protein
MNTLNFLDANVWLALLWGRHIHSERARDWLEKSTEAWADAYLLAFATVAGLKLITFDRALRSRGSEVFVL